MPIATDHGIIISAGERWLSSCGSDHEEGAGLLVALGDCSTRCSSLSSQVSGGTASYGMMTFSSLKAVLGKLRAEHVSGEENNCVKDHKGREGRKKTEKKRSG